MVAATLLATLVTAAPAVAQPAADPVPVVVAEASRMELSRGQSFVGTVYPFRESDVGSAVDGRLVNLPIEDGQQVHKGDTLAELLTGLLEIERAGALASLDQRRQELAELEAGSRPEEIEQATAEAEGLEARLTYAESRLNRLEKLFERGTATTDGSDTGTPVCGEFVGGSTTSRGLPEETNIPSGTIKALINALDHHITYTDLDNRGYAVLEITPTQATCEFKRVQTQSRDGGQTTSMAKFVLPSGSTTPQQVG